MFEHPHHAGKAFRESDFKIIAVHAFNQGIGGGFRGHQPGHFKIIDSGGLSFNKAGVNNLDFNALGVEVKP